MFRTGMLSTLRARVAVLAVVLLIVGAFAALAISSGGDGGGSGGLGSGDQASTEGLTGECADTHAGHHIMAWDSTMADEMVAKDCPFPYEPFLTDTAGGAEDPALTAPFEPHRYEELATVVGEVDLGLCGVAAEPDPPADGFVFGFRYQGAPPGCPDATSTVDLVAREYATKAHRDAAAHEISEGTALVYGRWSLQVVGTDQPKQDELTAALVAAGAQPVAPT